MLEHKENSMGEKEEADERKEFTATIETSFEMELPPEVIKALKLSRGDSVQYYEDDDGQIYLKKA